MSGLGSSRFADPTTDSNNATKMNGLSSSRFANKDADSNATTKMNGLSSSRFANKDADSNATTKMNGLSSSRFANVAAKSSTTAPQLNPIAPSGNPNKFTPPKTRNNAAFDELAYKLRRAKDALRVANEKIQRNKEGEQNLWNAINACEAKAYEVLPEQKTTLQSIFEGLHKKKDRKKKVKSVLEGRHNDASHATLIGGISTTTEVTITSEPNYNQNVKATEFSASKGSK